MKIERFALTLFVLLTVAAIANSAPSVDEIVAKANLASYYGGDDGSAIAEMVITDKAGRTRERKFTILRRDQEDNGPQLYYVYFHKPGDVRKTVFMVHKKVSADDDRWLFLPALDLVKRIGASDKRTSFVGSHFFYEDVSGRSIHEDHHELKEETDLHYVLRNSPKDPGSVEFASYDLWIDKKTFLPVKAEYVDKGGTLYRRVEALEIGEVDSIPTVLKSRVEDLSSGGTTVLTFSDVKYNVGLNDKIFTERYLRRPPKKFLSR